MTEPPTRPTTGDRSAWRAYWMAQDLPWRTEPEIGVERQTFLAARREVSVNIEHGIYPFRDEHGGIKLDRADVEWLLATHESDGSVGPIKWEDMKQRQRRGLDLRGADLRGINLSRLPLSRLIAALTNRQAEACTRNQRRLAAASLENADLFDARLEAAELGRANLAGSDLTGAHLETAVMFGTHFEDANLKQAHLEGGDLRSAHFSAATYFSSTHVGNAQYGAFRGNNIHWGGSSLDRIEWSEVPKLGDEHVACRHRTPDGKLKSKSRQLTEYQRAVQCYRQFATALRTQGLNEIADRFAYRAQVLQRRVFMLEFKYLRALGSLSLDLIAGYGYRPLRSFVAYGLVILAFAAGYHTLGGAHGSPLNWNEALVVSMTAFHGRGFFSSVFQPGDVQAAVAAVEAFCGLLIEITFIATFTQRLFGR